MLLPRGCLYAASALSAVHGSAWRPRSASGPAWWQNWWEPCAQCHTRLRVGRQGDGGKWLCVEGNLSRVVSVGSNNEFSYERDMHRRFGSRVAVYDHTSAAISEPWLTYHKLAMTKERMRSVARHAPNVLKIDCEGCEYDVFDHDNLGLLHAAGTQIQIEVHFHASKTPRLWGLFQDAGYYAAHKEPNLQHSSCVELLLVPRRPVSP